MSSPTNPNSLSDIWREYNRLLAPNVIADSAVEFIFDAHSPPGSEHHKLVTAV